MKLPWQAKGAAQQPVRTPAGKIIEPPKPGAPGGAPAGAVQQPAGVVQQPAPPQETAMEAKVSSRGGTPQPGLTGKRVGKWSIDQLRQTDGIIPLQNGTNRFDSQKGMTGFGTPRNTALRIKSENLQIIPEEIARMSDLEVRPQSGTNRFASQRGMVNFGTGRDVCRESNKVHILPADLQPVPEEKERLTDGIVRLQSGTNRYATQKGMTGMGTNRRELTKMLDTKHPELDVEHPDQSHIPLQSGTNKFASQKGMTGFGTSRRETTKMLDTKHPEETIEHPDQSTIPSQMGSNRFASQANWATMGAAHMGAFRMETMNPYISRQRQEGQGIVPSQMGSNQFDSQKGMTGFGTPRDVNYHSEPDLPFEELKRSETIIRSQAGWNKGDSQKGTRGFGAPRDVKGKHLKRIWELEYPEEADVHHL